MTDSSHKTEQANNASLKARIKELEDTIHAIQSGGVDALVISTDSGDKVFTLENADQPYRLFVENMSEGAFTFTEDGTILYCNRAFSAIFHLSHELIIGHNISEYVPERQPDGRLSIEKAQGKIAAALAGETQLFEWVHLRSDGTAFDAEVMINRILLKDDYCLQAIIRDITERKRSVDALALASRKINLLLSITRHDINNQLLSVNGFLTLLHRKVPDPSLENYFTRITKASSLIYAMIQFTKVYEEIGVQAPVWQDCRKLVDTAAKQVQVQLVVVINDLPPGSEVFADPLIVKVFFNLIDNAVRYGGKITTIRFYVKESERDNTLICEDDGTGIHIGEKERIFDRGFGKNTGLGLFLSREILDMTGIIIRETGEPGIGARFEITIPSGMYR